MITTTTLVSTRVEVYQNRTPPFDTPLKPMGCADIGVTPQAVWRLTRVGHGWRYTVALTVPPDYLRVLNKKWRPERVLRNRPIANLTTYVYAALHMQ